MTLFPPSAQERRRRARVAEPDRAVGVLTAQNTSCATAGSEGRVCRSQAFTS